MATALTSSAIVAVSRLAAPAAPAAALSRCCSPGASSFLAGIPSSGAPRVPNKSDPQGFTRIGSIVRVKMIDFMIYTLEEMFPGPGLNLLLGPNGSGRDKRTPSATSRRSACGEHAGCAQTDMNR